MKKNKQKVISILLLIVMLQVLILPGSSNVHAETTYICGNLPLNDGIVYDCDGSPLNSDYEYTCGDSPLNSDIVYDCGSPLNSDIVYDCGSPSELVYDCNDLPNNAGGTPGYYEGGTVCSPSVGSICNICGGNYSNCPHSADETYGGTVCAPDEYNICNICGDDYSYCSHYEGDTYGGTVCSPYDGHICNICDDNYANCSHINGQTYDATWVPEIPDYYHVHDSSCTSHYTTHEHSESCAYHYTTHAHSSSCEYHYTSHTHTGSCSEEYMSHTHTSDCAYHYTTHTHTTACEGTDSLTWYKMYVGNKTVYIKEPETDTSSIEARVCDDGASTALVYSYIGGQWISSNTYAYIPGSSGGVGVASIGESNYISTLNIVNDVIIDVTEKVNYIKQTIVDSFAFDPDYMTQENWNMVILGITTGVVETTFPEYSIWNPISLLFNKNIVKALIFTVAGDSETNLNNNYHYINSKTGTEYCIMIAAKIIEAGSLAAATVALEQAGISLQVD